MKSTKSADASVAISVLTTQITKNFRVTGLFRLQSWKPKGSRSISATLGMTKSGYPWREKGISLLTECPDQITCMSTDHDPLCRKDQILRKIIQALKGLNTWIPCTSMMEKCWRFMHARTCILIIYFSFAY